MLTNDERAALEWQMAELRPLLQITIYDRGEAVNGYGLPILDHWDELNAVIRTMRAIADHGAQIVDG